MVSLSPVVHVGSIGAEAPGAGLRDALPIALASDIDLQAVLSSLLGRFLAPGACDKVVHSVSSLGKVEGNAGKLAGASALHVEDLHSVCRSAFDRARGVWHIVEAQFTSQALLGDSGQNCTL